MWLQSSSESAKTMLSSTTQKVLVQRGYHDMLNDDNSNNKYDEETWQNNNVFLFSLFFSSHCILFLFFLSIYLFLCRGLATIIVLSSFPFVLLFFSSSFLFITFQIYFPTFFLLNSPSSWAPPLSLSIYIIFSLSYFVFLF